MPPSTAPPSPWAPAELAPSEGQWAEVLPPRRRQQYWRSRSAMRHLLATVLGCTPRQVPLHSPPGQPPQLAAGCGWLSLSHADEALLIGWSSQPLGVDLEAAGRRFEARSLMERFFPLEEQQQLAALEPEPLRCAVLRSWVCKEAAIKWRQRGLAQELSSWRFDHDCGRLAHRHEGTGVVPLEGQVQGWRWAAVGPELERAPLAPLVWRLNDG